MDHNTFDTFVRRTATLLDRRSLVGGLRAALLAAGSAPLAAEAEKSGKNNRKNCKN